MKEAMFYSTENDNTVNCKLCKRFCRIENGKKGFCGVRENQNGVLKSLVFGKAIACALDPIEKKPFCNFRPGTKVLSIATIGCNFKCLYCQNWNISQSKEIRGEDTPPEKIIEIASKKNANGIAWTYTEPTIFFEYFYETAKIKSNFFHVWVSNGYTSEDAIKKASEFVSAVNIDYKGNEEFYKKICKAELDEVQDSIKTWKKTGTHIEITNLLIPNKNDSEDCITEMVLWIKENLGKETPLHFSRYHPEYLMREKTTSLETIEKAVKIAKENGMINIHKGNI